MGKLNSKHILLSTTNRVDAIMVKVKVFIRHLLC